jgi:hypothetical protein
MKKYYVYMFCKPDGTPYYVGKGHGNRTNETGNRSELCKRHIAKYGKNTQYVKVDITEEQSFKLEIRLVKKYGRIDIGSGILTNHTNGGEGASNPSKETTEKRSSSLKATYKDPALKAKLSESKKLQWVTKRDSMMSGINNPAVKEKQKVQSKDRWENPEYREKVMASRALVNDKRVENIRKVKSTKEHKEKLSVGVKSAWEDPKKRAKFIDGMKTDKAIENRSKASKARWENPEHKEMMKASRKAMWQDPAYRKKVMEARAKSLAIKKGVK